MREGGKINQSCAFKNPSFWFSHKTKHAIFVFQEKQLRAEETHMAAEMNSRFKRIYGIIRIMNGWNVRMIRKSGLT